MPIYGEQKTCLIIIWPVNIELILTVLVEVILIVTVCSKIILFVNAVISNSPVAEFNFITEELDSGFVPAES